MYLLNRRLEHFEDRRTSIFVAYLSVGLAITFNFFSIISILKTFGINTSVLSKNYIFGSGFLNYIWGGGVLIFSILAIYFFLFKHYKIADEVQNHSPWKKPIVWGGVYLLLSYLVYVFTIFMVPIDPS